MPSPCFVAYFLLVTIALSSSTAYGQAVSDQMLAARDSTWYVKHPGQLPQWETLEERNRRKASFTEPSDFFAGYRYRTPLTGTIRAIAEFEPMEGVLIADPFGISNELISEMAKDTKVYCLRGGSPENEFKGGGVNRENIIYISCHTDSYWTRDYGPWWIMNETSTSVSCIDFRYNRPRPNDDKSTKTVASFLQVACDDMPLEHAGGNYMCDGGPNAASTDLVREENGSLSAAKIDEIVKQYLGIANYHVTIDPLGDYIKHIDCWGKFLGPDKVLIGKKSGSSNNKYDQVAEFFSKQKSAWGTPYRVYRVFTNGEPYTNSTILNKKVLVPTEGSSNDAAALAVYKEAMPGYQVIGFKGSWQSTDALHCRTNGIADRGMLYISHMPLHDTITSGPLTIEASIVPYSKKQLIEDSTVVYYKLKETDAYTPIKLTHGQGSKYSCTIPTPKTGTNVYYYIHAADASGRSENHPYIGAPDPHVFYSTVIAFAYPGTPGQNHTWGIGASSLHNGSGIAISYAISAVHVQAYLSIFDISGKLILRRPLRSTHDRIIVREMSGVRFSPGIYIVSIANGPERFTRSIRIAG